MTDNILKPCPFCGEGECLIVEHMEGTSIHPAFRVRCDNCGASSSYTDKSCHKNWNTRAPDSTVTAKLEELQARINDLEILGVEKKDGRFYYSIPQDICSDILKATKPFERKGEPNCLVDMVQYVCTELTKSRAKLEAAEKLIAVFMEFKFLQEDWKVKEAIQSWQKVNK